MTISRVMKESMVLLEMTTIIDPPEEEESIERWRQSAKAQVLFELVDLLDENSRVGNRNKLLLDFVNREKQASTGLIDGVAIPHIRSKHAKEFMIGFGRSTTGYDFNSMDSQPTHLFFIMAAPPYEDNQYLKVFKALAEMFRFDSFRDELMNATHPGEIIRAVRAME